MILVKLSSFCNTFNFRCSDIYLQSSGRCANRSEGLAVIAHFYVEYPSPTAAQVAD